VVEWPVPTSLYFRKFLAQHPTSSRTSLFTIADLLDLYKFEEMEATCNGKLAYVITFSGISLFTEVHA